MNKEKQIEEMAEIICQNTEVDTTWNEVYGSANAGYRKASEVAREIFEEIDRMIYKVLNDRHYIMGDMCYEVAELKKKYTEGSEKDDG